MKILSEESRLLIENWETVEDIINAKNKLTNEFSQLLYSIESSLQNLPFWDNRWHFEKYKKDQVYITHSDWKQNGTDIIWIGVEGFNPNSFFGNLQSANMYLWVSDGKEKKGLVDELRYYFKSQNEIIGEVSMNNQDAYIIRKEMKQWVGEDQKELEELLTKEISEFFSFFGEKKEKITEIYQRYEK